MRNYLALALCLIVMGAASCSGQHPHPRPAQEIWADFSCDNGEEFQVLFTGDQAEIYFDRNQPSLLLIAEPVASGYSYRAGAYQLRGKGTEAYWSIGNYFPVRCEQQHARRPPPNRIFEME